jgi:hypothetical protein
MAGTIRISTDNPDALASGMRELDYVEELKTDFKGILIKVPKGREDKLYEDVPKLAKRIKVRILGIETSSASLEELYTLAVSSEQGSEGHEKR